MNLCVHFNIFVYDLVGVDFVGVDLDPTYVSVFMCFHTSLIRPAFHSIRYSSLKINTVYPGLSHNHESFQCETYVIHSGQLRQGIQFSCNCNIKVT